MSKIVFAGRRISIPGNMLVRVALGVLLIFCGFLGFLPILGFWMIPLGLAVLAIDFPPARRLQRRLTVGLGGWLYRNFPRFARHFGYGSPRAGRL